MVGHRCTKIEAEERHSWIVEQIAAFRPRPVIVREVLERWGISRQQALRCMQRADKERAQVYDSVERIDLLTTALQAAEKAVELAISRKNPNEIIGAVRLLNGLTGFSIDLSGNYHCKPRPWNR